MEVHRVFNDFGTFRVMCGHLHLMTVGAINVYTNQH